MKVLFLLTRYLPFIDVTLVLYCTSKRSPLISDTQEPLLNQSWTDQLKPNISVETCHATYIPAGCTYLFRFSALTHPPRPYPA